MKTDAAIFGRRPARNAGIEPSQHDLDAFLTGAKQDGSLSAFAQGLAGYRRLLEQVAAYQQGRVARRPDVRDRIYFGVLGHVGIISLELPRETALYLYHLHALTALDFDTPLKLLRSKEKALARLSRTKLNEVVQIVEIEKQMAESRQAIEELKQRWVTLASELRRIALYVRENLVLVEKRAAAALDALAARDSDAGREQQLVDEIRSYVIDQLKNAVHQGQKIPKEELDRTKQELDQFSYAISAVLQEDGEVLAGLYRSIRDRAKDAGYAIAGLLADIEAKKSGSIKERKELHRQIAGTLTEILTSWCAGPPQTSIPIDEAYRVLVAEKRHEMSDQLFGLIKNGIKAPSGQR